MNLINQLKQEFSISEQIVGQIVALLDDGNTIPFIARYRKEKTDQMDDQVLRKFSDRLTSLRLLQERQAEVIRLIDDQGVLTPVLEQAIQNCVTRAEVDDIYRPFRPKRKSRATSARDAGLQPLADLLLSEPADVNQLEDCALQIIQGNETVKTPDEAFKGAMDILAETVSDDAWIRRRLRRMMLTTGVIKTKSKSKESSVYDQYAQYEERVATIPGHRILAINRGEREDKLSVRLVLDDESVLSVLRSRCITKPSAAADWLEQMLADAWKRLLQPSLETDVRRSLTERAEEQAIVVFAANLRSLLMQQPMKDARIIGLDPGYRTGCKVAIIDQTGQVLHVDVIYPTPPQNQTERAGRQLLTWIQKYEINRIAIGNGTASRETELFVKQTLDACKEPVQWSVVNEAGASVYSASSVGAKEFPDYDVSLRSAVSIARRLQDPLAELVKIEPRSIGVGQYQHDMNQKRLDEALKNVVEDCVNEVGVNLNTASAALLGYISGLQASTALKIIQYRETHGSFSSRLQLTDVPGIGPKAFQQAAGFLRIPESRIFLDNTSVHPESYHWVEEISRILGLEPSPELAKKAAQQDRDDLAHLLSIERFVLDDLLDALAKPGRDPRVLDETVSFSRDILDMKDLKAGMTLQGVVRNVADFGAFIDIGVHQDGLIHISELSDSYVRHPLDILKPGQSIVVRVIAVDSARGRISLSLKGMKPVDGA
ncbi:MAG: RNA-binding transcriptional accessory protein [Clostridiaceae bacterium]|nr:RNA-binding transcriptional accessory protein [Clostridiaceae bacterium]